VKLCAAFGKGKAIMSKIGRKAIELGNVKIAIEGQLVKYEGARATGEYKVPVELMIQKKDNELYLVPAQEGRDINRIWGLHRALLANCIKGAATGFTKQIEIVGLGYKAITGAGNKVTFSLGYSHKIEFPLPDGVSLTTDKTGQLLTLVSSDRELLGSVCGKIKELRKIEPYKGTGIKLVGEFVMRKAGKTKSA